MFVKSVLAIAVLAASVLGQTFGANSTIEPSTVDLTERARWCESQMNTCGSLCLGDTSKNDCDENTLIFSCTCTSNNSSPGLQYYDGSLPTYICEEIHKRCINATVGVAAAQAKCNEDEKKNCGTNNATEYEATQASSTSSSSSAASTPSPTSAGAAGGNTPAPSTTSSTGAAATMLAFGGEYGAGIVAAGVAAAFGMMV